MKSHLSCGVAAPVRAQAQSPLTFTCPLGTQASRYDPGITLAIRHIEFTTSATYGGCVGLPPDPDLPTTAALQGEGSGDFSCLTPASGTGHFTLSWDDGRYTSQVTATFITVRLAGNPAVIYQGEVTGGLFRGYSFTQIIPLLNTDVIACLTPQGVTAVGGPSILELTGL